MLNIKIDGKNCTCEKGETILTVAKRNGIYIPTLCMHDAIKEVASCRLCICEVIKNGKSQVVVACVYPIETECEILTNSEKILKERGVILMLLHLRAPESKEILELCEKYNAPLGKRFKIFKGEKCIMCGKCALACKELGASAISTVNRGMYKEIATPYNEPSKACIGCLSCAHVCPTNAIEYEEDDEHRKIWGKEFKIAKCTDCGAPIGTYEEVAHALLNMKDQDTSYANLCPKCRNKHIAKVLSDTYGEISEDINNK